MSVLFAYTVLRSLTDVLAHRIEYEVDPYHVNANHANANHANAGSVAAGKNDNSIAVQPHDHLDYQIYPSPARHPRITENPT